MDTRGGGKIAAEDVLGTKSEYGRGLEARTASALDFLSITVDGKMPTSQQISAIFRLYKRTLCLQTTCQMLHQ